MFGWIKDLWKRKKPAEVVARKPPVECFAREKYDPYGGDQDRGDGQGGTYELDVRMLGADGRFDIPIKFVKKDEGPKEKP